MRGQSPLICFADKSKPGDDYIFYDEESSVGLRVKKLKFDHMFAEQIANGSRSTTIRIDDKGIVVGDRIQMVDKVSASDPQQWTIPGELIVEAVQEFHLSQLPSALVKELSIGDADSPVALYDFLKRFYGDQIHDDTVVKVITFTFEPYGQPMPYMLKTSLEQSDQVHSVNLYADGGSRGNPGPSAAGFVILDDHGQVLQSWNKYLGITTNNQAEYHALVAGLEWCKQHNVQDVEVYLDSLLVVNQLKGAYKVKNRDLWALYEAAKRLQAVFKSIHFTHVPREMNKLADAEVNKALDAVKGDDLLQ